MLFFTDQLGLWILCNDREITVPHPHGHLNMAQYGVFSCITVMTSFSLIAAFPGVLLTIFRELKCTLGSDSLRRG